MASVVATMPMSQFNRGIGYCQDPLARAPFAPDEQNFIVVDTIADLIAYPFSASSFPDGQIMFVTGYLTPGDGGGGWFRYNRSSTATDNGGTIIEPVSGFGRYLRLYGGALNVQWFGAVGAGDVTDAFDAAILAGDAIYAPDGRYNLSRKLTLPRSGMKLYGDGVGVTILNWTVDVGDDFIYAGADPGETISFIEVEGFSITCDVVQSAGAAIHFQRAASPVVNKVWFTGNAAQVRLWDGVWFDAVSGAVIDTFYILAQNDCLLVNGQVAAGNKAGLSVISGNIISGAVGIHVAGAFGGLYVTNTDISVATRGVVVDMSEVAESNREIFFGSTVSIDGSAEEGVYLDDPMTNGWISFDGTWVASSQGDAGIRVTAAATGVFISIVGGTVFNNAGDGILVENATALVSVNGVTIRNNTGYGVNCTSAPNQVQASENRMFSNTLGAYEANVAFVAKVISAERLVGAALGLSTGAGTNLASISLPPGRWSIDAVVNYNLAGTTGTQYTGGASTVSGNFNGVGTYANDMLNTTTANFTGRTTIPRRIIVDLAVQTTFYLVASAAFTVGTVSAYGTIEAKLEKYNDS